MPPPKMAVQRSPSRLQGAQKLISSLLAVVTQVQVPSPQGNDPREGLVGECPEAGFGLYLFSLVVAEFSVLHGTFPTHQQIRSGHHAAGHPSCLCMPPVFMLHHLRFSVSFSNGFPISTGRQNHFPAAYLLNCTLAPSCIGTQEKNHL